MTDDAEDSAPAETAEPATFVARPYLIPSESMEPTLHGCPGCVGDRIMVDKLTYRFTEPEPGDVVVFKGPPAWNVAADPLGSAMFPAIVLSSMKLLPSPR